jgi:hypothetical protein
MIHTSVWIESEKKRTAVKNVDTWTVFIFEATDVTFTVYLV